MANQQDRQKQLSQNFFTSARLVRKIVQESSITAADTVYEIGPGEGILTMELAKKAYRVIAIEKDWRLLTRVRQKFRGMEQVQLVQDDFLRYHIENKHYKVFANIPYCITAPIVRKLLFNEPTPEEAYLVIQKEAAEKFAGLPKETQFSILCKAQFKLSIIRRFRRTDFSPVPFVDSVLLHIQKRSPPLVPAADRKTYHRFVQYGFQKWKRSLKSTYKPVFTYTQWKRMTRDNGFQINATPTELTFDQWLGLYQCFKEKVPAYKQQLIWR